MRRRQPPAAHGARPATTSRPRHCLSTTAGVLALLALNTVNSLTARCGRGASCSGRQANGGLRLRLRAKVYVHAILGWRAGMAPRRRKQGKQLQEGCGTNRGTKTGSQEDLEGSAARNIRNIERVHS